MALKSTWEDKKAKQALTIQSVVNSTKAHSKHKWIKKNLLKKIPIKKYLLKKKKSKHVSDEAPLKLIVLLNMHCSTNVSQELA